MRKKKILAGYKKIKKVFPSAILSNTHNFLLIPELPLPAQFNLRKTPMLIKLHPYSDYKAPEAYVDGRLRVYGRKSHNLDESLTEKELLDKGWVKLCVIINWSPSFSLVDFLITSIKYLEGLRS